ncbi:MAG: MerR family DNA-binding protein [Acidobacteriota bacterium]|nr:MerR family DNA-binding protein [Acidobacteriota bacterium]
MSQKMTAEVVHEFGATVRIDKVPIPTPQYKDSDVSRLRFIRQAKSLGYTLGEITRIFHESSRGNSPCPMVRQIIAARIEENGLRLNELAALQQRMELALGEWSKLPDGMPDGESVCYLIESAAHV